MKRELAHEGGWQMRAAHEGEMAYERNMAYERSTAYARDIAYESKHGI